MLSLPDEDYIVIEVIYGNGREITPETHGAYERLWMRFASRVPEAKC